MFAHTVTGRWYSGLLPDLDAESISVGLYSYLPQEIIEAFENVLEGPLLNAYREYLLRHQVRVDETNAELFAETRIKVYDAVRNIMESCSLFYLDTNCFGIGLSTIQPGDVILERPKSLLTNFLLRPCKKSQHLVSVSRYRLCRTHSLIGGCYITCQVRFGNFEDTGQEFIIV